MKQVAVIGAGVMGSAIAAHIANADVPVLLLDIVPEGAANAIRQMLKTEPAPFVHARKAVHITPGNLEDDLEKLREADWIIEAIVEDVDVKHALYQKIESVRKKGSIVSSNTSTIPLMHLIKGQSKTFAADFLITHFFNPPRYMRLLELVAGKATRKEAVKTITDFCDIKLGKGVVQCHDTPGFIANRIGTFWIQSAVNAAFDLGLTVEEADAVMSRPLGIPKTGVFGLIDLVGLDLMPHISKSLLKNLPKTDAYHALYREEARLTQMIKDGYTGRKGKGGFYRLKDGVKQALNLKTGDYAPAKKPVFASVRAAAKGGIQALMEHPDKGGVYAARVLKETLAYTESLVPEIADTIADVDAAMRLGYNWKFGPFELMDQLGADWYKTADGQRKFLTKDGKYIPIKRRNNMLVLEDIKGATEPLQKNASASLWDIGDGVACLEFHSKMNSIDPDIMEMIQKTVAFLKHESNGYKALVIYNEGPNFSVGANIGLVLFVLNLALWPQIEQVIENGQEAYKALKFAPFPVVGAPSGMALGGGCEILLHCDAIQAHIESYIGLVEGGVGVIPGWGGCKEMLLRHFANKRRPKGPIPPVAGAFETIGMAKVAKSAEEARDLLFLRPQDGITMNRDRLLADAKAKALSLTKNYTPPTPVTDITLPGPTAKAALDLAVADYHKKGQATAHDVVVAQALSIVLSGGKTDITETLNEDQLLELERRAFMTLIRTDATVRRIEHMLETGKPLRN